MGQQYLSTDPSAGDPITRPGRSVLAEGRGSAAYGPAMAEGDYAPDDLIARLSRLLEPMAHPQTVDDFGHLLMTPTDATRGMAQQVPNALQMLRDLLPSRQGVGTAVQRGNELLHHPLRGTEQLGDAVATRIKGAPPPPPPALRPRVAGPAPTLTDSLDRVLNELRQTPSAGQALPETGAVQAERTTARMLAEREAARRAVRTAVPTQPARASVGPSEGASSGTPAPAPAAPPAATPPRGPQTTADLVLTSEERQALSELMKQGYSRKRVLQQILTQRQQGASPTAKTVLESSPKVKLNAAEAKEFQRLLRAGKSESEAFDLIRQLREMQQRFGLPSSEQTRRAVLDRNQTGRWPE